MATAPTVQSLNDIMASLQPGYQEQQDVINKEKAAIPAQYDAERSALNAEKTQGFNQINDTATGRGMSFSGIPLDEQATYLSTKYLPGMQSLDQQQNKDNLTLEGKLADLNTNERSQALSIQNTQQGALNAWNLQQQEEEATAEQNALNRAATAHENALNGAAEAAKDPVLTPEQAVAQTMAAAGTRYNNKGKIVSANGAAESTAAELSAQGYGNYKDLLNKAYAWRKSTYGEN